MRISAQLGALTLVAAALSSTPALACGGFFCAQQPVVQTNERIVFVDHADGRMSMMVEVQYSGTASAFAWVLPVAGVPTVGVGSTNALNALTSATSPQFFVASEGSACSTGGGAFDLAVDASVSVSADASPGPGVIVLDAGHVGPYDYVVIQVDSALPDPAEAGRVFLEANGFDVSAVGGDILNAYLAGGDNLLAFRLQKDANVGAIRPVILTYDSRVPVIPIRPTAIAARAGLPIEVYVYGGSRAVSSSYDMITIPDAAIDWRFPATSYASILPRAIDEAGGHAFVTEFAGPSPQLALGAAGARASLASFEASGSPDGQLVLDVVSRYTSFDGLQYVLARHGIQLLPWWQSADGGVCQSFSFCIAFGATFDRTAFLADIDAHVVTPYEATEALLVERPYLTRLMTQLDPAEMDLDPVFTFTLGLPDVSNIRRATLVTACVGTDLNLQYAHLSSGRYVSYFGPTTAAPLVDTRLDFDPLGQSAVIWDRAAEVLAATQATPPAIPAVDAGTTPDGGGMNPSRSRFGCAVRGRDASDAPLVLAVAALAVASRRRRRGGSHVRAIPGSRERP